MTEDRRTVVRNLELAILDRARTFSGRLTLDMEDMVTGERVTVDEDAVMATASVIKMFIMAALYDRVHRGEISLSDRVRFEERHRTLGSGIVSYLDEGVEMSVRDAAVMMMSISDNSTANICFEAAGGVDAVNEWCREHGFEKTVSLGPVGDVRRVSTAASTT